MIETYFISDTHFGHKNILEYEKKARPFNTIEEMNEKIIENWNKTIRPQDIIYHLGDFAFGKHNVTIAKRLNGKKRLVMGNHDTYPSALYLEYFEKLYGCVFWERCVLSHMPIHYNGLGARWKLNIHGHLHSKNIKNIEGQIDLNFYNVSCEQNNLTPIHRDVILLRLQEIHANKF